MLVLGTVLPGGRPIPGHLGGIARSARWHVAGLAGDAGQVGVDAVILVRRLAVAVGAGGLILLVEADRDRPAANLMILGDVTIGAQHVLAAHVHVEVLGRVDQVLIEVAVLDGVAAAAGEVARATVLARRPGDALRHVGQIDALRRQPGVALQVGAGVVMTHQAVDLLAVAEVEIGVLPAVAGVAGGASRPVGLDADAEVVQAVLLADGHRLVVAGHLIGLALPGPVDGLHHLAGLVGMALQAGPRHFVARGIRARQQRLVIGRWFAHREGRRQGCHGAAQLWGRR